MGFKRQFFGALREASYFADCPRDDKGRCSAGGGMTREVLTSFADKVKTELGLKSFDLHLDGQGRIELGRIEVPKSERSSGRGSAAMTRLIDFADKTKSTIWLSVANRSDGLGTTSQKRLHQFYGRFGFVRNKGRHKDYELSSTASMYRLPRD